MARSLHHHLPTPAERPTAAPARGKRPVGVRLWLAIAFVAVGSFTGASVYLFVQESSEQAASEQSDAVAIGRTFQLRNGLEARQPSAAGATIATARSESYRAWVFGGDGDLITNRNVIDTPLGAVPDNEAAVEIALSGDQFVNSELDGELIVVALPIFRDGVIDGAVLSLSDRPEEVQSALDALRGERLTALAIALFAAGLIGFSLASVITRRVKRLADGAAQIAEGRLDEPLTVGGRDEVGDLGAALDSMRLALRESFEALSSERDRLSTVFSAMSEAVVVVDRDGMVRFANPAADELISGGRLIGPLEPWIGRAMDRGAAEHGGIRIEGRVYALQARDLPVEEAALVVVRDRTEELRREIAEREFVSNAAHELRNPIAGISGAIEVLRAGAKDDPEARDHFLERLSQDAERVSRLTRSLLTLARMEAIGEGEAEVVSVEVAAGEAVAAAETPEGLEVAVDIGHDLAAKADPVLLRQVLIGLLTNAYKNTPAPGTVTLRARKHGENRDEVLIEVVDTGTGIAEEERDRVFERFYRGSGSLEQEGFGLGLSIAKRMVMVMRGEIGVESEPGAGSIFWIRLPAAEPSPTPVA